ncbi:RING finger protein nhl-1, partial [Symbiodinium microadriaticum]
MCTGKSTPALAVPVSEDGSRPSTANNLQVPTPTESGDGSPGGRRHLSGVRAGGRNSTRHSSTADPILPDPEDEWDPPDPDGMPRPSATMLAASRALAEPCEEGRCLRGLPRADAVGALRRVAPWGDVGALKGAAARLRDTDHEVRREAVAAVIDLAPGDKSQALQCCTDGLEELDWRARAAAVDAMVAVAKPQGDEEAMRLAASMLAGPITEFLGWEPHAHQRKPFVRCKACVTQLEIPPAPIASGRKAEQSSLPSVADLCGMRSRCLLRALAWACLMPRVADSAYSGEVVVGVAEPLRGPMGVALAPDGGLIVVDTDQNRILKCPNWQLQGFQQAPCALLAGGSSGFQANRLRMPYTALPARVVGDSFGLVVADTHNHRIQYWPAGATQGYTLVGGPGVGAPGYTGPGEIEFPAGIALDEDAGYLYVSDTGHHRVVRYALDAN